MSINSSRPRVTDAKIADAAAVDRSTVSRWADRPGFPPNDGGHRDRDDVVAHMDGVLIHQRWRIVDADELARRVPQVGAPEQWGATYGDRLRASWDLTRREQNPACVPEPSPKRDEDRSKSVAREVIRLWDLQPEEEADPTRRPVLFSLAALLLLHHKLGHETWKNTVRGPREVEELLQLASPSVPNGLGSWWTTLPAEDQNKLFDSVQWELSRASFALGSEGTFLDKVLAEVSRSPTVGKPFFSAEYFTPSAVADLMTGIAMFKGAKRVYLPGCGTGELAWSAVQRLEEGAAITALSFTTPGCRLTQVGVALRLVGPRVHVQTTTRLTPGRKADVIIMNPPSRPKDNIRTLPPSAARLGSNSSYRWVEIAQASMDATSRALIVMPRSAATSSSTAERQIRENLLRSGLLRAVVNLPKGVFPQARAAMSIWVLANSPRNHNNVLLIDSARLTVSSNGVRDLLPTVTTALATALSQWIDGDVWRPPRDVEWTVRSAEQIISMGANLDRGLDNASVPLFAVGMATPTAAAAAEKVREDVKAVEERHRGVLGLEPLWGQQEFQVSLLKDVCNLQAGPASQIKTRNISHVPVQGAATMIEPEMVGHSGRVGEPIAWLTNAQTLSQRYTTRHRDLVLTRVGKLPKIALIKDQKDWIQGRGVLRIRVDEGVELEPEFLFYYLRQGALSTTWLNVSDATASPSVSVRAIENMAIPMPSLKQQKDYIATIHAYAKLQMAANELRIHAEDVTNQLLARLQPKS